MIELVTSYLEMRAKPEASGQGALDVRRLEKPATGLFRSLYNSIGDGRNGYWWVRREMSDRELGDILVRAGSAFFLLYEGGNPAGFYELDVSDPVNIEIAFFGIMPGYQGRGLGRRLLDHAVQYAWQSGPRRLWLHTCNYDSPHALAGYMKAGFSLYAREKQWIPLPEFVSSA